LSVALDPKTGRIQSLKLGAVTEWLARNGIGGNVPLLFTDESARAAKIVDALDSIRVIERGPVRSVARIERTIGGARIVQDLVLYANRPELEIETHVDGTLGGGRLCTAFEIKQVSPWVVHGVPFGATARPCAANELASPIRALDWIAQSTAHSCFTLCDEGGATFGAGARTLSLTLDDSLEGEAPAERTMRCKVCVGTESWRVRSAHAAAELEHPPQVLRVESHEGTRAARYSFLHLARVFPNGHAIEGPRSGLMLTAYKLAEDGDGCVLRVYESKGQSGTVRLTFDRPVFAAQRVDVLERACGDVRIDGCTVELSIEPYRIESVRVAHRAH
jgi:alpha-mannosidase